MSDPSNNNSFIPKRGPAQKRRSGGTRKVYAFSIISYTLVFATLVGSAGVFLYDRLIQSELDQAVAELDQAIQDFSNDDMIRVAEFDSRLSLANLILDQSVSILPVFSALERSTINTVWLRSLNMEREDDSLQFSLAVETDTFDSTIFQRGRLVDADIINNIELSGINRGVSASENNEDTAPGGTVVSFTANLDVPLSAIPFTPGENNEEDIIILSEPPTDLDSNSTSTATNTSEQLEDNQTDL
jgi:hypothetical protein